MFGWHGLFYIASRVQSVFGSCDIRPSSSRHDVSFYSLSSKKGHFGSSSRTYNDLVEVFQKPSRIKTLIYRNPSFVVFFVLLQIIDIRKSKRKILKWGFRLREARNGASITYKPFDTRKFGFDVSGARSTVRE